MVLVASIANCAVVTTFCKAAAVTSSICVGPSCNLERIEALEMAQICE